MNLIEKAAEVQKFAYAPYSKFRVGCAVVTVTGKIFVGCNVENASIGATVCAERAAICAAIAAGEKEIAEVYIINSTSRPCAPCGICLQTLVEFGHDVKIVTCSQDQKKILKFKLTELLPQVYDNSFLK